VTLERARHPPRAAVPGRPRALADLKSIYGLGEARIGKFGDDLLEALRLALS
jgi:hypothetical protein